MQFLVGLSFQYKVFCYLEVCLSGQVKVGVGPAEHSQPEGDNLVNETHSTHGSAAASWFSG